MTFFLFFRGEHYIARVCACKQVIEPVNTDDVPQPGRGAVGVRVGVVYPTMDSDVFTHLGGSSFDEHLGRFRPFGRNLVKNWNAAG